MDEFIKILDVILDFISQNIEEETPLPDKEQITKSLY